MGIRERVKAVNTALQEMPVLYTLKHRLDQMLPVFLVLIFVILYLEFLAASTHPLYPYKQPLHFVVLGYFVAELAVDFMIYEQSRKFFRDRWLDILLTIPLFTAFKGVNAALRSVTGLKLLKPAKGAKAAKAGKTAKAGKGAKVGKSVKLVQKAGKAATKGKKLAKKRLKHWKTW